MKVIYTPEQRDLAVTTYHRVGSFAKTIRILEYPSRHVLHNWVRGDLPGTKPAAQPRPPQFHSWEFKAVAVNRVLQGESVKAVAKDLGLMHVEVTVWSGSECNLFVHDALVFDRRQTPQPSLSATSTISTLDPRHNCQPELVSGARGLAVQGVLLEPIEERLHRRVV